MAGTHAEKENIDRRVNSIVADTIKQSLIEEFLKKNPNIKREEVIAQFINGEWVIEHISAIIRDMFKEREIQEAFQQDQIIKEIEMESDDRYRACQQSVKNSKRIVDFLFQSSYASFGLSEKNENQNFLNLQESRCAKAIAQHYKNKRTILELMAESNPVIPKLKGKMLDYFNTLQQQLDFQYKIFDREVVLNNEFSGFSQSLIKDHIKDIQTKVKDSKKKQALLSHIAKSYQTLKQSGHIQIESVSAVSMDKFSQLLNEFDSSMSKKREELESIQKVIQALEKVVSYLETSLAKEKTPPCDEKPQEKNSEKSSSIRMAISSKMSNLFSRVKKGFRGN